MISITSKFVQAGTSTIAMVSTRLKNIIYPKLDRFPQKMKLPSSLFHGHLLLREDSLIHGRNKRKPDRRGKGHDRQPIWDALVAAAILFKKKIGLANFMLS